MAKCTITICDDGDLVDIATEFDPPLPGPASGDDRAGTTAELVGLAITRYVGSGRLRQDIEQGIQEGTL